MRPQQSLRPTTAQRRWSTRDAVLCCLAVVWVLTPLAHAEKRAISKEAPAKIEASKESLDSIHARIESLKKELNESKEAHAEAADELKESEQAISETNRKLYEIEKQQNQHRDKLTELTQEKSQLNTTSQAQQNLLAKQLYQQYLHGQQNYLQVILQQKDPSKIARDLYYFGYISRARAQLIQEMKGNLVKLEKVNQETARALASLDTLKQQQKQEQDTLKQQKDARRLKLKQLSAQITAQSSEIEKLKRDEKNLADLVVRLAKEQAKKRAAKQAANKPANNPKDNAGANEKTSRNDKPSNADNSKDSQTATATVATNHAVPDDSLDGAHFASLKGKLALPVRGDITNRFGSTRQDTGITWKGLFIKSNEGSEVRAIALGRVVFADWMRGFGNLLIIDHGDGYMSLYGNNQSLYKRTGDAVKGGETIAAVGNTGGNPAPGLYYELRKESRPFDPLSWSQVR